MLLAGSVFRANFRPELWLQLFAPPSICTILIKVDEFGGSSAPGCAVGALINCKGKVNGKRCG